MNNEMMYKMFLNTLAKMNDQELETSLKKAKELLSEADYNNLVNIIEKERNRKNEEWLKIHFKLKEGEFMSDMPDLSALFSMLSNNNSNKKSSSPEEILSNLMNSSSNNSRRYKI